MTQAYLQQIESSLASFTWAKSVQVLRCDVLETATTTYRFHLQDHSGNLIKRWDNAPHFSGLNGFPHHIHMGKEDHVVPGKPINGLEILDEIDRDFFDVDEKSTQ